MGWGDRKDRHSMTAKTGIVSRLAPRPTKTTPSQHCQMTRREEEREGSKGKRKRQMQKSGHTQTSQYFFLHLDRLQRQPRMSFTLPLAVTTLTSSISRSVPCQRQRKNILLY